MIPPAMRRVCTTSRERSGVLFAVLFGVVTTFAAPPRAHADEPAPTSSAPPTAPETHGLPAEGSGVPASKGPRRDDDGRADLAELAAGAAPSPPPLHTPFIQYGVALTAEALTSSGKLCDIPTEPCVIGSGGGIAARIGKRSAGPLYLGGTYELSKLDSNKLYRLGILQQVRGEARYYIDTGRDVEPYGMLGLGFSGYGNEWAIDTFGPVASISIGAEAQLTRRRVVGAALSYRVLYLKGFTDSGRTAREAGLVSFIGLDLILEARDPL